jgi:hypothetical protein
VSRRPRLRYWLLGLAVYLAALAAWAPAALLVPLGARWGDGRIVLAGLDGSLWNGRAERLELRLPGGPPVRLERVHWRFLPHRLLTGGMPLYIENAAGAPTLAAWLGAVRAGGSWAGFRLGTARVSVPLDLLAVRAGGLARPGLHGRVELRTDGLTLGRPYAGRASGELRVDAGGAGGIPPGRYALTLDGRGERLAIRWRGPEGPRAMSGTGWWDGRLHLDGVPGLSGR